MNIDYHRVRTRAYFLWLNREGRRWWCAESNWVEAEELEALWGLGELLRPFTAAVLICRAGEVVDSATCGLVDTGAAKLLITAEHVVDSFKQTGTFVYLAAGNSTDPVQISGWAVVDSNKGLDVATIAAPKQFNPETIQRSFLQVDAWPPHRAKPGDNAIFVGYAGLHREQRPEELVLSLSPCCVPVSSSSPQHFVLADESGRRRQARYTGGLSRFGPLGGLSGTLVFIERHGSLVPAGVFYEGDETERATMFVAHLDHINQDGSIDFEAP